MRTGRVVTEDEAEEKVLRILVKELTEMGAPVLLEMESTARPERTIKALMGKYRASTLRRLLCHERCRGSSRLAGIPGGQRLADNQAVDLVVKDLVKKLERKGAPIQRAPRWLTMMIGLMESLVMDRKAPLGRTVAAWKKLVKVWGALRFSDAANMKVKAVRFYDGKLTATLQKTKTTGAGKRVRELPLYISQEAYVSELAWLEIGYNLVKRTWRDEGEYVFNEGAFDGPDRSWAYEVLRGLSKQ